jgi:hypothetical protein
VTVAPLVAIEDLPKLLAAEARLLGLDVGTKTIGLALSDVTRSIATPYHTARRTKFTEDAKVIQEAVEEHQVGALVIGLPINLDGSEDRAPIDAGLAATLPPASRCPWSSGTSGFRPPPSNDTSSRPAPPASGALK